MQSMRPGCQWATGTGLVHTLEFTRFALYFLGVALNSGSHVAFANSGGLLVKLAAANFGQYTCFFASALEATQSDVKRLVFFNLY